MSLAAQRAGYPAVVVEPGSGAVTAAACGVTRVVHSTLEGAEFTAGSLDAVGPFDVIEHVEDDGAFVATIHRLLRPSGRLYCTVPAMNFLWSAEEVRAGHFRRHSQLSLSELLRRNSMEVEFLSPLFAWLIGPVWCLRAMPHLLGFRGSDG